ncbi:MAG TPA: hypothetical protein VGH03_07055 [Caulobacteraceae bacterium]
MAQLRKPTALEVFEHWVLTHEELLGLGLAMLFVVCTAVWAIPMAPFERFDSTVQGFGVQMGKNGSYRTADIQLPDRTAAVRLPYGASCRVGDRIHLLRERYLFGHLVHADWAHPDPCEERTASELSPRN